MTNLRYEVLLDIAKTIVESAAAHPEAESALHRKRLNAIAEELDAMYGAVLTNKGLAE